MQHFDPTAIDKIELPSFKVEISEKQAFELLDVCKKLIPLVTHAPPTDHTTEVVSNAISLIVEIDHSEPLSIIMDWENTNGR